jgi:14-3-3 protein epsilon
MLERVEALDNEDLLFLAKVSEQAERYDDCVAYMEILARREKAELSCDERSLLAAAFKNLISNKRAAWRALSSLREKYRHEHERERSSLTRQCREVVEQEISVLASKVLDLIQTILIPKASSSEAKVFFFKLVGDYLRYTAEFDRSAERQKTVDSASAAYQKAFELAQSELQPTHPIRLGLALNYSVFLFDVLDECSRATVIARAAFDEAVSGLDNVSEEGYKDSTLVISLLRDNLVMWASYMRQD